MSIATTPFTATATTLIPCGRIAYAEGTDDVFFLEGDFLDDFDTRSTPKCGWGFALPCPDSLPVIMFYLLMGESAAIWFADLGNEVAWKALEGWHSFGHMAIAADLEDGTCHWAIAGITLPPDFQARKEFGLKVAPSAAREFGPLMANLYANGNVAEVAFGRWESPAGVKRAQMVVLPNANAAPVTVPTDCLRPSHRLRWGE